MNPWIDILRYSEDEAFLFSNPYFWLLTLVIMGGYEFFYRREIPRSTYLFAVSLFIYYKSSGIYVFLLFASILFNYAWSFLLQKSAKKSISLALLWVALLINISCIGFFKYAYLITETLNHWLGTQFVVKNIFSLWWNTLTGSSFEVETILLPAGISFFTFQVMSYLIDVYRNTLKPEKSFLNFGFYVSFFPQLVAGPIVRAAQFLPQCKLPFRLTRNQMLHAFFIIASGLLKKLVVADYLAFNYVDRIFDNHTYYSGFEILMGVYAYAMQIYCDFSGYSDIAIGISLLFGFHLPDNFRSPYKALSLTDFWHRWHISLSTWLKDYLYISLGGNRKGKIRTYLHLFLTMVIGGLWHGANIRFIIWGAMHGLILMFEKMVRFPFSNSRGMTGIRIFFTFQLVCLGWVFFRSADYHIALDILYRIGMDQSPELMGAMIVGYWKVYALLLLAFVLHYIPNQWKENVRGWYIVLPLWLSIPALVALILLIAQVSTSEMQPFIYFRF